MKLGYCTWGMPTVPADTFIPFLSQLGYDGIDVDWEFPVQGGLKGNVERPADKPNFTLLLAELRRGLDAQGKTLSHALLAMTVRAPRRLVEMAREADREHRAQAGAERAAAS